MVIFDENWNVVENPDLSLGFLLESSKDIEHAWIIDSQEEGHWETIKEYPNGGKDIEWIIDSPQEGHWETRDSETKEIVKDYDGSISDNWTKEDIHYETWQFYRYIEYSEEELEAIREQLKKEEKEQLIEQLQKKLWETDYVVIKVAESQVTGVPLDDERSQTYSEIITQREQWREEIRKYEAELEVTE